MDLNKVEMNTFKNRMTKRRNVSIEVDNDKTYVFSTLGWRDLVVKYFWYSFIIYFLYNKGLRIPFEVINEMKVLFGILLFFYLKHEIKYFRRYSFVVDESGIKTFNLINGKWSNEIGWETIDELQFSWFKGHKTYSCSFVIDLLDKYSNGDGFYVKKLITKKGMNRVSFRTEHLGTNTHLAYVIRHFQEIHGFTYRTNYLKGQSETVWNERELQTFNGRP